jgi:hypothetical protein
MERLHERRDDDGRGQQRKRVLALHEPEKARQRQRRDHADDKRRDQRE